MRSTRVSLTTASAALACVGLALWLASDLRAADPAPRIPLAPGLTIVTAISGRQGDYESIKRIESADAIAIRLKYSSERPKPLDIFDDTDDDKPRPLQSTTAYRRVLRKDLADAEQYLQQFAEAPLIPEIFPGTTALGVSRAVLRALKTAGTSDLTVYQAPVSAEAPLKVDREPGELDFRLPGTITRVERNPVMVPVIVNNRLTDLPAIHARGDLTGDEGDFYFLDDLDNPLALRFTIGHDSLTVVKINFPGGTDLSGGGGRGAGSGAGTGVGTGAGQGAGGGRGGRTSGDGGTGTGSGDNIEQSLAETGRVDVYGIYFSFNSDRIRDESDVVLKTIADVMTRHADWKLAVDGHTDNIGGASYNQDLSTRRSAAVVKTLVDRYHIAPGRFTPAGFGASRPKATNDTLAGRALNRRVELVKQ